ncbi:MAG: hypothetical protein J3K34DRAFT_225716 [Monoraphidium minutum]|nr:MAG: hypothetical protein J3K34DRAFT_225716 [Monoraphidium minutum]
MMLREREFHRLAQTICWGFTSVRGGRWRGAAPRAPAPHKPACTILGFGDASIGHQSPITRNCEGIGPVRAFEQFFRSCYTQAFYVSLDEYRTSKVCTLCWSKDCKQPFRVGGARCHALQACQCRKLQVVVHRDQSACFALMARLLGLLFPAAPRGGLPRFERTHTRQEGGG